MKSPVEEGGRKGLNPGGRPGSEKPGKPCIKKYFKILQNGQFREQEKKPIQGPASQLVVTKSWKIIGLSLSLTVSESL